MQVRFAPKADKRADVSLSPLSANRDLTRRSKKHRYSITLVISSSRQRVWYQASIVASVVGLPGHALA
jgi:hypothetical protein